MAKQALRNVQILHEKKIKQRLNEIERHIHGPAVEVTDTTIAEVDDILSPQAARKLRYRRCTQGDTWGTAWSSAWFRLRFRVPADFAGRTVVLRTNAIGESIVYQGNRALGAIDFGRTGRPVLGADPLKRARAGATVDLLVESTLNRRQKPVPRVFETPTLHVFREDVWDAWNDLRALHDLMAELDPQDPLAGRLRFQLNKAVDLFDYAATDEAALRASSARLRRHLAPLLASPAHASAPVLGAMGHAHIDVAWLWPLRETVRKTGRTFSSMVDLMDRYPEFIFCQSQPHLYWYTKKHYPELYRRIREKVQAGQWIPTGAMWVEADANIPSGESFVRQVLFGTRFFREEFDMEVASLWLPDVFGYSSALPQILKRSGINYFLTQKISWCQFNTFPYHSFWWKGLDGTRVLTHFPPADTYNATVHPREMLHSTRNYNEKDRSPLQAYVYGYGDGGGGATAEMLELARRYRNLEGSPRIEPMTPRTFFERLEAESEDLPEWVGELYLELHRATLTTQARNKRFNRMCELLLRDAEYYGTQALLRGGSYPQQALHEAWRTVLLNQFHDIIPGSSITEVYEDSDRDYAEVVDAGTRARDAARGRVLRDIDTRGEGTPVVVFNTLGHERVETVSLADVQLDRRRNWVAVDPDGHVQTVQIGAAGEAVFHAHVPSFGHTVYHLQAGGAEDTPMLQADAQQMENEHLRVRFAADGSIRSLYDKHTRRETVPGGARSNVFTLYEDKPCNWDAWDIDVFYRDKPLETGGTLVSSELIECGPVRAVLRQRRTIGRSTIRQDIILSADARMLVFDTQIDWADESHVLLKVGFPVDVMAERARFDIQFGSVERTTHSNTPRDLAQFEVAAHKWVDLAEGDYGVAVLNDCKYGHDVHGNVISMSLLRAPKQPDEKADINKTHPVRYALLPHAGDFRNGVVQAGYALNTPLDPVSAPASAGDTPARGSQLAVTGDNIVIDAVKKAEDDDGIIVRLHEAHGVRGRRTLHIGFPFARIQETDLMERPERVLKDRNGRVALTFTPFQIRTLKVTPA